MASSLDDNIELEELEGAGSLDFDSAVPSPDEVTAAPADIFGPRSRAVELKLFLPSYMHDMFGGGHAEVPAIWAPGGRLNIGERYSDSSAPNLDASNDADRPAQSRSGKSAVIDDDDRRRVLATSNAPWRSICQILVRRRDGRTARSTGWFVAPRVVMTAGHALYDLDGVRPLEAAIVPGRDGDIMPFNPQLSRTFIVPKLWRENHDDRFDFGAVILPDARLGLSVGHFGVAAADASHLPNMKVNTAGYPSGRRNTLWWTSGRIHTIDDVFMSYDLDTERGQSGSPIYHVSNTKFRTVLAIHTDSGDLNIGRRITPNLFEAIRNMVRKFQPT